MARVNIFCKKKTLALPIEKFTQKTLLSINKLALLDNRSPINPTKRRKTLLNLTLNCTGI